MAERTGSVIFLNGASSSGKSTIAKGLQQLFQEPYLHLSIDAFLHQLPAAFLTEEERFARELPHLLDAFNSSCAAIARAGSNIVVDTVLQEPSWVTPCVTAFEGLDVVFVAVRCSLEELEAREKMRGDRHPGLARYQYDRVHLHGIYDVELDATEVTPEECVAIISDYMRSGVRPLAFEKLRMANTGRDQRLSVDANEGVNGGIDKR